MSSSSLIKICAVLFLLGLAPTIVSAVPATTSGHRSPPSPVKCMHHHATLTACAPYLKDDDVRVPQLTEACCRNYGQIFRSGTPTCLCRYLHPEKLKTSFSVAKLMSLHDVCQSTTTVPLYDLCVGLQHPQEKFDGILQVVNNDIQMNLRHMNNPSAQA